MNHEKQLAVLFPGIGYHADRPLLYYSAKLARAHGCEVTSVQYPALLSGLRGNPEQIEAAVQTALSAVEPQLEAVLRTDYDRIFFFSKSIGTAIAARYAARHGLHPGQVYFTPIEAALPDLDPAGIVVPGTEIGDTADSGARFLDNKRMEGTIANMFSEAMAFCMRNMKTATIIDPETGKRCDKTEYPVSAIREAVLNALIHRDYSIYTEGTPIQIDFFSDRLEIHSPGSLYGRMSVEDLGFAHPDARNPVLAVMTESLTDAEHRYSGIPTMRRAMQEAGLPAPVFINRQNEFVVVLYNHPAEPENPVITSHTADKTAALLQFCRTPRTRKEIADFLGIGTVYHANKRYIQPLVEQGRLKLSIPDKPSSRKQTYTTDV